MPRKSRSKAQEEWEKEDFTPYLDTVVETFGCDRIMFGSDWPVCLLSAEYNEALNVVSEYFTKFSKEEQEKIFGLNCLKFCSAQV